MAQKFGNGRWVRDGFLDNRTPGSVVGRLHVASLGPVEVCLQGDFKDDLAGRMICLRNSGFEDDEMAGQVLDDMESPQLGTVFLISFDPHPNLPPHPYIEWFSQRNHHYRIELAVGDAWIATADEEERFDPESAAIRARLADRLQQSSQPFNGAESDWA
ncbi:hypothetical protein YTPLAS18_11470 [Nitrospira sp.]|nr:hypothetical protein YTPLAS18_11470 [Nitrospira sp.]